MTLGAIVATQLTDQSARAYRLNVGPVDVLKPYGASWATRYGVILDTIALVEEGPGGVSSLSFTVDDPRIELTLNDGSDVEFWDVTNDRPLFAGFLQSWSVRPEGTGRYIDVVCIGLECLLDWILVPYCPIPAGTWLAAAVQSLVYCSSGIGWGIRAFSQPSGSENPSSTQAWPTAQLTAGIPATEFAVTIEGQSLRQAIADVVVACNSWPTGAGALATIDFYSGLRLFLAYIGTGSQVPFGAVGLYEPQDYDTVLSTNTSAGTTATTGLEFTINSAGAYRAVYIVGGVARTTGVTPIGSGLVSDGSGVPGPVAYLNEPTSLTDAIRDAIGVAYLAQTGTSIRGSLTLDTVSAATLAANVRAGSDWTFDNDVETFAAEVTLTIYSIRKSFLGGGQQRWDVAFGGLAPSAVKQLRRLTRDTRN